MLRIIKKHIYTAACAATVLLSLHPGVSREQVMAATGFALTFREPLADTPAPTERELCLLREEIDPHRYILGRC